MQFIVTAPPSPFATHAGFVIKAERISFTVGRKFRSTFTLLPLLYLSGSEVPVFCLSHVSCDGVTAFDVIFLLLLIKTRRFPRSRNLLAVYTHNPFSRRVFLSLYPWKSLRDENPSKLFATVCIQRLLGFDCFPDSDVHEGRAGNSGRQIYGLFFW